MINYELNFDYSEDLTITALCEQIQNAFPGAKVSHAGAYYFAEADKPSSTNIVPFPIGDANTGCSEAPAESELPAPGIPDSPVVADDAPADISGSPASISKEDLKKILFHLRDEKGADAVKALYEECGQGAKTLKTLDESCYFEMFNRAVKLLAE